MRQPTPCLRWTSRPDTPSRASRRIAAYNSTRELDGWVDDELFPFESRFVDIDGHSVHYVDEGSGPTLLFLHGNPTWSFVYRDVIESLRDEFRCVAVDYPKFRLSSAAPGTGICLPSTPR